MFAIPLLLAVAQATPAPTPPPSFDALYQRCKAEGEDACKGEWRGLTYTLDQDGTWASFKVSADLTWRFHCRTDAMDDTRTCVLSTERMSPYLMVIWASSFAGAGVSVAYLGDRYPGSTVSLRVDSSPALTSPEGRPFGGARSAAILAQIRTGNTLRLRAYDWPYNAAQDEEIDLTGAGAVLDAAAVMRRANGLR